jgi:hypothetical protein
MMMTHIGRYAVSFRLLDLVWVLGKIEMLYNTTSLIVNGQKGASRQPWINVLHSSPTRGLGRIHTCGVIYHHSVVRIYNTLESIMTFRKRSRKTWSEKRADD